MKNNGLIHILKQFDKKEIAEAVLVGAVYYLLLTGIIVAPIISISLLFVPYILYFLMGIFIALSFIGYYATTKTTETLQTFNDTSFDVEECNKLVSMTLAIVTFIAISIVYFMFLQ